MFVHVSDGFPKNESLDKGWVGGCCELYPVFFWIMGICLTLQQSPLAGQLPGLIDTAIDKFTLINLTPDPAISTLIFQSPTIT